ncbi:MAG: DUF3126 family protein [Pseudomonadota bacterium]
MQAQEMARLETYLRKRFNLRAVELRQLPGKDEHAEVFFGDQQVGQIFRDTEEGDLSYDFSMKIETDADKLQEYMRDRLATPQLEVRQRTNKDDSAEIYIDDEFIGVVFEDGDVYSYAFNMSILEFDLEDS